MKLAEIKKRAKELHIKIGNSKKAELIRNIQEAENNTPCFLTGILDCPHLECSWRADCIK